MPNTLCRLRPWRMVQPLCLAVVACSDPVAVQERQIRVSAGSESFTVENLAPMLRLAVVLVDARDQPLILLAPCDTWPDRIPPGGERQVPYEDVFALHNQPGPTWVHWCFLHEDEVVESGQFEVDPFSQG